MTDLEWTVEDLIDQQVFDAGTSLGHTLYLIFGKPALPVSWEAGSTLKRMVKAVDVIGKTSETDPHKIAEKLQALFTHYTLLADASVPKELGHPSYYNTKGNAWCMADYMQYAGECQAMVRYMLALMKQVGCPGTVEAVLVWADEDDKGNVSVKEGLLGLSVGLGGKKKVVGEVTCTASLVDRNPVVGHVYTSDSSSSSYLGVNDFEACIRVDHAGKKKYYPGGLQGPRDSPQEVIKCFYALCWLEIEEPEGKGFRKFTVHEVTKRWLDAKGVALP